jgi:hypothetical protein
MDKMDDETCSNTSTLPSIDELSCDSSDFELESFAKSTTQPYQFEPDAETGEPDTGLGDSEPEDSLDSLSRLFTTEW